MRSSMSVKLRSLLWRDSTELLPLQPIWQAVVPILNWMMRQEAAGGLKIIGTERHESRRIDNQLRGRSGRQGDPGESRFYISLEDDLMRLFGSERLMSAFNALGVPENEQIEHKMLTSAIEKAQMKIENNNFGIRKNLLEYDQVMNEQREIIYAERRRVLDGESMRDVHLQDDRRCSRKCSRYLYRRRSGSGRVGSVRT